MILDLSTSHTLSLTQTIYFELYTQSQGWILEYHANLIMQFIAAFFICTLSELYPPKSQITITRSLVFPPSMVPHAYNPAVLTPRQGGCKSTWVTYKVTFSQKHEQKKKKLWTQLSGRVACKHVQSPGFKGQHCKVNEFKNKIKILF